MTLQGGPGIEVGALSFSSGAVEVHACAEERELWRCSDSQAPAAERLLQLGRAGVGGFERAGRDERGLWFLREAATLELKQLWSREPPLSLQHTLQLCSAMAQALATCERQGFWPGPLQPSSVRVRADDLKLTLRADALVWAEFGLDLAPGARPKLSTRWTPPEQASGAAWDHAANRYVLGLMLYRMLAGEHPTHGQGLRLGLQRLMTRGAAPFSEAHARKLPVGLQAYCLRLLCPEPALRPASAAAIAARLASFRVDGSLSLDEAAEEPPFREPERMPRRSPSDAPLHALAPSPTAQPQGLLQSRGWSLAEVMTWLLPVLALALGGWVLSGREHAPESRSMPRRSALGSPAMGSQDCESCHRRQTAEWRRSVMSHSVKSPLFLALEALIQEQVGRSALCEHGAGVMRKAGDHVCRDPETGRVLTGTAGEHWCVNCHAPAENLAPVMPPWDALAANSRSRLPLDSLLPSTTMEGISCAFCHQVAGAVRPGDESKGAYVGNASWVSALTGTRFLSRPEDQLGRFGIANSAYRLDPGVLLPGEATEPAALVPTGAHRRIPDQTRAYLRSSEFCGACHDVRLFGTDVLGGRRGEHFKRLRNAYSEWRDWARERRLQNKPEYSCQDCHMSLFPGICVPGAVDAKANGGCPEGTRFEPRSPGSYPWAAVATNSTAPQQVRPHYFSGVDLPLAPEFPEQLLVEHGLDSFGLPLGAAARRDLLLAHSIRLTLERPRLGARGLEVPLQFENTGAGHRIPAGFSQERELWLHLTVTDSRGQVVYEVGQVERGDEDLRDKRFLRVNTAATQFDAEGRPLGVFGADVADGPDVPRWLPDPALGGREFRGRGLVNFQNGFLRCVVCQGSIDAQGRCQPLAGQETARADRYADGDYDVDTGRCVSNLTGEHALFETYFPVGSLDATRGVLKAPDAIIDTRSLPPEVPIRYTYEVPLGTASAPYQVRARLMFRAFPPFLLRAFVDYEKRQAERGLRPSGPLLDERALERLDVVELGSARAESR